MTAKNANQVIGVLAHETGHITGGHLSRFSDGASVATTMTLLGAILGAAAIAAGSGDAGMALILGGQTMGTNSYLAYSRTQESSADQAGLTFLEKSEQSGRGLIEFLDYLGDQELLTVGRRDPYAGTHPVSTERISKLRGRVEDSRYAEKKTNSQIEVEFKRLQAKLFGYLKPAQATLTRYAVEDQSLYARYARSFAYHKAHNVKQALLEINSLIKEYPDDPYFQETKGQILFENGRIKESVIAYRKAVERLPDHPLIRVSLAQSLLALEHDRYIDEALENITFSLSRDQYNAFAWRQASIAYHRQDNVAMTHYATAEHFLLIGNQRGSIMQARLAVDLLPKGSVQRIRAQDIIFISRENSAGSDRKAPPQKDRTQKDRTQKDKIKEGHTRSKK
jgi:predicted Zn-dependent protease